MKRSILLTISSAICASFLYAEQLPEGVIEDNNKQNKVIQNNKQNNNIAPLNANTSKEVKDAVEAIKALSKATREAEYIENPNLVKKTPEELDREKKEEEMIGNNKSLSMIKDYLNEFKKTLILKKVITNVTTMKIKKEKIFVDSKLIESNIAELDNNIRQFKAIKAQITLIDRTIKAENYRATELVYNSFSNILSQISSSVNLSGSNNGTLNLPNTQQSTDVKYNEYRDGDRIGTDIYLRIIGNNSIELYYKEG